MKSHQRREDMAGEGGGEGRGEGRSSALGIPEEPRVALTDGKCRGKQDVGLSTPVLHVASVCGKSI